MLERKKVTPSEKELEAMAKKGQAIVNEKNQKTKFILARLANLANLAQAIVERRNRDTLLARKAKEFSSKENTD